MTAPCDRGTPPLTIPAALAAFTRRFGYLFGYGAIAILGLWCIAQFLAVTRELDGLREAAQIAPAAAAAVSQGKAHARQVWFRSGEFADSNGQRFTFYTVIEESRP